MKCGSQNGLCNLKPLWFFSAVNWGRNLINRVTISTLLSSSDLYKLEFWVRLIKLNEKKSNVSLLIGSEFCKIMLYLLLIFDDWGVRGGGGLEGRYKYFLSMDSFWAKEAHVSCIFILFDKLFMPFHFLCHVSIS